MKQKTAQCEKHTKIKPCVCGAYPIFASLYSDLSLICPNCRRITKDISDYLYAPYVVETFFGKRDISGYSLEKEIEETIRKWNNGEVVEEDEGE